MAWVVKQLAEEQQFRDAEEDGMTIIRTRHPYKDIIIEPSDVHRQAWNRQYVAEQQSFEQSI
jgi:hypothetical protein